MRLLEAVMAANHRLVAGDPSPVVPPDEFAGDLPVIALTCIDPRLNSLLPNALGIREEAFIWLRNAGNIIYDPLSSMTRTLALACAVKGGREIAIIGHTDCRVRNISIMDLLERFKALGVDRKHLPENLNEFFGLFASERQNVIRGAEIVRSSPLIGAKIPVHGLLIDIQSGGLEWVVNGYETLPTVHHSQNQNFPTPPSSPPPAGLPDFSFHENKFPDTLIGETSIPPAAPAASEPDVPARREAADAPSPTAPPLLRHPMPRVRRTR